MWDEAERKYCLYSYPLFQCNFNNQIRYSPNFLKGYHTKQQRGERATKYKEKK